MVRRFVRPGEHLHLAATQSRPNALTYALCRQFGAAGRFTISTTAIHTSAHALTIAGAVRKVIAGFVGDTYPSPRPNPLYRDLSEGTPFDFEAWSLLSYVQRLMAGAMGLPYAVTGSLAGTDLAEGKGSDLHRIPDPADPRRQLTLVSALRPDLTLVHGACADEAGNVVLFPPLGEGQYAAYAARRGVLASVERIVSSEEMASLADRVIVPGQRVLGLCEAPMGAHPQSLRAAEAPGVSGYLEDYEFIEDIVDRCAAEERGRDWYREWVLDVGSHDGYLDKLGSARRTALRWDGSALPSAATDLREPASTQERVIVLGARAVADRVRSGGYDTLLAGIGASHMAAWLAAELLRREGCPVKIASELGAYGFTPEPGDVFLFSLRHAERAEGLGGIAEILGGMVSANPRALGVLGAAEIDRYGTINTSRSASGRWLTGSGGANDIASSTDCVVVAQASPRRFVPKVSYRTSPGDRVVEVASQFGRFTRSESTGEFRLTNVLTSEPAGNPIALAKVAAELVAQNTGWAAADLPLGETAVEEPITGEELALLRTLDPDGRYR
ncbi:acetate CoA-transferase [Amycolatopsis sp. DR6-1]|uniref:Acetate CoA-transferase n=1 Tax=Amycolatopsis dendrobii TaxID=2760662 RepID=A0A7W3VWL2_9PSEU|nr:acetate CoA-transferase [Amycolatopsis dendrobii]